jgi:predicted ATPase/DNA-binding CsgD family transcriptional regulator
VSAVGTAVTSREAEVLALVGRHLTNAQIAAELCISVRTVEAHVAALLRKTQLPDRRSLARQVASELPARSVLPMPVTPFIGRAAERAALTEALAEHRLVTAIGPGGIGKSRLAVSVAADLAAVRRDGAWFVDLVRLTDPAAVVGAVAEAVGSSQQWASTPDAALVASLARRDGILVLDNCEHLLDGVRDCVEQIVTACRQITVLATTRTRLLLPYECLFAVPGLSVPDAVELFATRVHEATGEAVSDAGRVGALCQALDGMALAIELAASRYPALGFDGLEAGLHERLRFFTVGSHTAGRHHSLRDTIRWSNDLLDPADQALLRGVAVFASWFDVDAAHAVAGSEESRATVADGLARLVDHSLLVVDRGTPTRYRALETIRQYGQEQLESTNELAEVERRHEAWCCAVLAEIAAAEADDAWCARFDRVVDDARAALVRCAAFHDHRADAAALAAQLAGQLWLRGRLTEARRWFEQAADLEPAPAKRVELLRDAAGAACTGFAGDDLLRLLRRSADLALSLGDAHGAARDLAWMSLNIVRSPGIMAKTHTPEEGAALLAEAMATSDGSDAVEAAIAVARAFADYLGLTVERAEQAVALARQAGDPTLEDAALDLLTALHLRFNDLPAAVDTVRRRDELVESLPMSPGNGFEHSDHLLYGSEVLLAAGDVGGAADYADRAARLPFHRDDHFLGLARQLKVNAIAGRFNDVLRDASRFRASWERDGRPVVPNLASCAYSVAMVHGIVGDDAGRAEWVQITDDLLGGQPGITRLAWLSTFDALVELHRGNVAIALDRLAVDIDDAVTWWHAGLTMYRPWYAAVWAEAAVLARRDDARDRVARARRATRDNPITAAMVERAAAIAAGDRPAVADLAATFAALGCPYQEERTHVLAGSRWW